MNEWLATFWDVVWAMRWAIGVVIVMVVVALGWERLRDRH